MAVDPRCFPFPLKPKGTVNSFPLKPKGTEGGLPGRQMEGRSGTATRKELHEPPEGSTT